MSANPLQGIQVINSVNPCSSTPLHRPIYPYHLPSFPFPLRCVFAPLSPYSLPAPLSLSCLSSSLYLPHPSTWNLDSPLPGTTHPPLRPQEKVENCDYKDFPGTPPRHTASVTSCVPSRSPLVPSRSSLLLSSSSHYPRNLPHSPFFLLSRLPRRPHSFLFFRLFLIPSSPFTALPARSSFLAPRRAACSFSD